jgi:hypothetical protein
MFRRDVVQRAELVARFSMIHCYLLVIAGRAPRLLSVTSPSSSWPSDRHDDLRRLRAIGALAAPRAGRAPACSVIVWLCPNRGRGGWWLRPGWRGHAVPQGRAGNQRP